MREKAAKIIFVITLVVPGAIVLFSGLWGLAFGTRGFLGSEITGWEAFNNNALLAAFALIVIPVIPLGVAYDIAFLLRRHVKRIREMPLLRYIAIVVSIAAVIAGAVLMFF